MTERASDPAVVHPGDDFTLTLTRVDEPEITITGPDCETVLARFPGRDVVILSTLRVPASALTRRVSWTLQLRNALIAAAITLVVSVLWRDLVNPDTVVEPVVAAGFMFGGVVLGWRWRGQRP